jgi:CBS domain-containing protein
MIRTAAQLMQTEIVTIRPSATLRELGELLESAGVHGVPVVDAAGKPVGVVSRGDLVSALTEVEPAARPSPRFYAIFEDEVDWADEEPSGVAEGIEVEQPVSSIMSTKLIAIGPQATAGEIARKMSRHAVRRLLVLEGRKLVGIVSISDLLRCLVEYEKSLATNAPAPRAAPRKKTPLAAAPSLRTKAVPKRRSKEA